VLKKIICFLLGCIKIEKAFTGQTYQSNVLGEPRTGQFYRYERQKYCTRCGEKNKFKDDNDYQLDK
jgi:hypothetical protein